MNPSDDPNFGLVEKVVCPVTRKLNDLMKARGPEPMMMEAEEEIDRMTFVDPDGGGLLQIELSRKCNSDDDAQNIVAMALRTEIKNGLNGGVVMTIPGTSGVEYLKAPTSEMQCNCDKRPDDADDCPDMWCGNCGCWYVGKVQP